MRDLMSNDEKPIPLGGQHGVEPKEGMPSLTVAICGAKPMPEGDASGCAHVNQETGFGLAGGGYGVYMYCIDCGFITSKTQTD